jgi:hypothetical protein
VLIWCVYVTDHAHLPPSLSSSPACCSLPWLMAQARQSPGLGVSVSLSEATFSLHLCTLCFQKPSVMIDIVIGNLLTVWCEASVPALAAGWRTVPSTCSF